MGAVLLSLWMSAAQARPRPESTAPTTAAQPAPAASPASTPPASTPPASPPPGAVQPMLHPGDVPMRPRPGLDRVPSALVQTPADPALARLLAAARAGGAYARLGALCDGYSRRFAGTQALVDAAAWARSVWERDGVTVRLEPVLVRHWVRGAESLKMTAPFTRDLAVIGLGGTVSGTVQAPVVVVHGFDALGPQVKGKIVLYDVPMPEGVPSAPLYGATVPYRTQGAIEAARFGAVASLTRSVTQRSLYTLHTGAMHYDDAVPKIPSAAVTPEDADWIARLVASGTEVRLTLNLQSQELAPTPSWNVVGEIAGASPEVVLIGAHLDSWDVGQGANDDGAGVVEVMEALRAIQAEVKATGVKPARTIRGVLYANEEFGLDGGKAYEAAHGAEPHVAAMETDLGGGVPLAWEVKASPAQRAWLDAALAPLGIPLEDGGGGADISPMEPHGLVMSGLHPDDSHYFDVHHTNADTYDKVDPVALAEGAAAVTGWAWLVANAPPAPAASPAAPAAAKP